MLSSNIIRHDESRLLKPLELEQAAPIGHLLLTKEVTRVLGTGERALRLPGLVSSLLAIFLCARLYSRITLPIGSLLGVALLATSPTVLSYAASVKQYSGDVLVSVVLRPGSKVSRGTASRRVRQFDRSAWPAPSRSSSRSPRSSCSAGSA